MKFLISYFKIEAKKLVLHRNPKFRKFNTLGFFAVFGNIDFVGLPMAPKWPTEGSQGQYGMFRQHKTP